jgi:hypothetical protein
MALALPHEAERWALALLCSWPSALLGTCHQCCVDSAVQYQ